MSSDLPATSLSRRTFIAATTAVTSVAAVAVAGDLAFGDEVTTGAPAPAAYPVTVTVNGREYQRTVDARTSLLDLLREDLHLTGTKKGCDQGACGACTVLVDGRRVNACLTLAVRLDGAEITTIEGLARDEELSALQAAFIDQDAFQCGFCTPGQIVSGTACIREGHTGSAAEIREWMSGNVCRCGCYVKIVKAVEQAAGKR